MNTRTVAVTMPLHTSGMEIRTNVRVGDAPRMREASSSEESICEKTAARVRIAIGRNLIR